MKKAVFFGLALAVLFLTPKPALAKTAPRSGSCSTTSYNCIAGTTVGSSTCNCDATGSNCSWSSGTPTDTDAQNNSGCTATSNLYPGSYTFFNPTPQSFSNDLYGQAGADAGTEINSSRWVKMVASDIGLSIAADAIGLPGQPNSVQASAVGFLARGIDTLAFNPPASSIQYLAYMGREFHVPGTPETAYAADNIGGVGFSQLSPILQLWTIARNLAYLVFAIIFVIIGLMIMLRVKIDPKTAATIQNSLPKIVIALVLVTFSYAIAGFLIDIMYVFLALIVTLMSPVAGGKDILENLLSGSIFNYVANGQFMDVSTSAAAAVGNIVNGIVTGIRGGNSVQGSVLGLVTSGLAFLVVAIAILVALFRTWLSLIGAYANIILAIIGSPLMLMMDAIPGQNQFSAWLRNMLSNLLAFPVVFVMLTIGSAITTNLGSGTGNVGTSGGFVPPLLGAGNMEAASSLIGLGILLTIPKAVNIVQEMLKTPPFKYGNAWQESLTAGATGAQFAGRGALELGNAEILPGAREGARRRGIVPVATGWIRSQFS
ncbi:hypothetical protein M1403_02445 [Patescibacteria group bacterium]|nr:hypothetical protein [Patescibacteria group bacterium]